MKGKKRGANREKELAMSPLKKGDVGVILLHHVHQADDGDEPN